MGEQDIGRLMEVYKYLVDFCKDHQYNYHFTVDEGNYETVIEFVPIVHSQTFKLIEYQTLHPPISCSWRELRSNDHFILVPDILDFDNKTIIEFEEETGNRRPGAKLAKKGHGHPGDLPTKRDKEKYELYDIAKFRYYRLWESNQNWKKDLGAFIHMCVVAYSIDNNLI